MRIEDGAFVEDVAAPLFRTDPPSLVGVAGRPGTYRVTVRAVGYQDHVVDNIRVTRGGHCNSLRGARLNVALTRSIQMADQNESAYENKRPSKSAPANKGRS